MMASKNWGRAKWAIPLTVNTPAIRGGGGGRGRAMVRL